MAMESIEARLVEKTKALKRTAKREEYHQERKVNKESSTALTQPTERERELTCLLMEEYHQERKVNKESSTALTQPTERERELTCLLMEKDRQIKQLTTETQELRTSVDWLQNLIQDNEDFYLFDESI